MILLFVFYAHLRMTTLEDIVFWSDADKRNLNHRVNVVRNAALLFLQRTELLPLRNCFLTVGFFLNDAGNGHRARTGQ